MAEAGTHRGRRIALACIAAVVAVLVVRWRTVRDEEPPAPPRTEAPSPKTPVVRETTRPTLGSAPSKSSASIATEVLSGPRPTPPVFDFATLTPPGNSQGSAEGERPVTNEWFTQEDLQHPELYFERAAEIPELNRPEERRDTLEFFLNYRERLRQDLEAVADPDERQKISATIERYDDAIARLRALIDAR